jgi:hypothetical protein
MSNILDQSRMNQGQGQINFLSPKASAGKAIDLLRHSNKIFFNNV